MSLLKKVVNRVLFVYYRVYSAFFTLTNVSHNGVKFKMQTSTSNEVHRALSFKDKEPETIDWIDRFRVSTDEAVFYDVGANIGIYSLYAASRYPKMKVFSFEPEAQSFAALCSNFEVNRLTNAIAYQFAISDDEGLGELFVSSMSAGAGAAALGSAYSGALLRPDEVPFKQGIYKSSLDSLVKSHHLPAPTFLKIDVDGIEERILLGGRGVLSNPMLRGLLVEFQFKHLDDLGQSIEMLAACGLNLRARSNWVEEFGSLRSQNFIFDRD